MNDGDVLGKESIPPLQDRTQTIILATGLNQTCESVLAGHVAATYIERD
jgi:hypothetical protein